MKKTTDSQSQYLTCEHKIIYVLLMLCSGMMGAYTYTMRGGVFCNAQTANLLIMSIYLANRQFSDAFYFLIPITAYFLGTIISECLPLPVKKWRFLRWDTYLIAFEILTLLIVGFIPLTWSHHIVQVMINFIASMQYNTFRQAEGIPVATTFCTNHVRQIGIACARSFRKHDIHPLKLALFHLSMLIYFIVGGIILTVISTYMREKSIWIAIIPLFIALIKLIKADLTIEHDLLSQKPSGH